MISRALAAAALTIATVPAFAADLPTRKSAPIIAMPMMYNWTGFYAGVQGGWMGGGEDRVGYFVRGSRMPSYRNLGSMAARDGFIGGRLGYDWQPLGSPFVVGVVGDINADWAKRSIGGRTAAGLTFAGRSKIDWDGSLRLKAGYAFDRFLVYVTGGGAAVHNKYRLSGRFGGLTANLSESKTLYGGTIGAGVQYAITNNLVAGLEYRYTGVKSKGLNAGVFNGATRVGWVHTVASPDFHRVAATLDWKF